MNKPDRRSFLKTGVTFGLFGWLGKAHAGEALKPTPKEIEGPFHPITPQKDKDFDLTRVDGKPGVAKGTPILIEGKVVDTDGAAIEGATVELWQANAAGRYAHPHDKNPAPLDSNFQGWAIVESGKGGAFRFRTVVPGAYPADEGWMRPPHIHYKVGKLGYVELTTQMYFPDSPLNNNDLLFKRKSPEEQKAMVAEKIPAAAGKEGKEESFRYQIVLEKVRPAAAKDAATKTA